MRKRTFIARVLPLLTVLIFTSAGTVGFLEPHSISFEPREEQVYHFDFEHVRKGPYLNLKTAILVNYDNGEVLYTWNANKVRPIASISKLVTAMVVLDRETDLSRTETISRQDAHRSSRSRFRVGSKLTLKGLLYAALMSSDNRAARALARATSGTIEAFTREMNRKVRQMGLKQTVFVEPTGLDSRNVSTAHETAKILHHALTYDLIEQITTEKRHTVQLLNRKNHRCNLSNTNRLLWSRFNVLSGKTGYIRDSDYCLTTLVKNRNGERLTLVVLGVPGDRLRFKEARRLLDWGFRNIS